MAVEEDFPAGVTRGADTTAPDGPGLGSMPSLHKLRIHPPKEEKEKAEILGAWAGHAALETARSG